MRVPISDSDLNGIDSVLLDSFNLGDLASVYLYDRARDHSSPFIPVVSHAHLVADNTSTLTFVSSRLALFNVVLSINF